MYSHCSRSGAWPCPPPPRNLKVKKTKVIRGNFELFHLYFATLIFSLTHNFLNYFLSSVPPEKKKENEKPFGHVDIQTK